LTRVNAGLENATRRLSGTKRRPDESRGPGRPSDLVEFITLTAVQLLIVDDGESGIGIEALR
jgi:hypothetical protein